MPTCKHKIRRAVSGNDEILVPGKIKSGFTEAVACKLNLTQRAGILQGGKDILAKDNSLYKSGERRKSMADLQSMRSCVYIEP